MRQGRVLFVIHDNLQDFNYFPVGIATIAAVLRDMGAAVDVYCQDLYHHSNEDLAAFLDGRDYDLIGLGFLAARFVETVEGVCKVIREHKKNAFFVLGGHGPSPIPEYILRRTCADGVVIGAGEYTTAELLRELLSADFHPDRVSGLAWRDGDTVHINPARPPVQNLDTTPFPAWDVFPMEDYCRSAIGIGQDPSVKGMVVNTSKGCVNACNFCYRMERGIRLRSIDNVMDEIKILYHKYGIRYFFFCDEIFVVSKKRILEFERKLEKTGMNITFACDSRVDVMDRELVESLKRCGCTSLCFGIESADDNVLRLMGKNTTVEQNIRAVECVRDAGGIALSLGMLWGNPGDSEETLWKDVDFIKTYDTLTHIRTLRPPTPYPGSELYHTALRRGLLSGPDDFFSKFRNSDLFLVNFTEIPTPRCYELLLAANREVILHNYRQRNAHMDEAGDMIRQYEDLYSGKNDKFRGARPRPTNLPRKSPMPA